MVNGLSAPISGRNSLTLAQNGADFWMTLEAGHVLNKGKAVQGPLDSLAKVHGYEAVWALVCANESDITAELADALDRSHTIPTTCPARVSWPWASDARLIVREECP
jgi:hypothetical protein